MNGILTRKEFTRRLSFAAVSAALAPLVSACNSLVGPTLPNNEDNGSHQRVSGFNRGISRGTVDITLNGDVGQAATIVRTQFNRLLELARGSAGPLRIAFPVGRNIEVLGLTIVSGGAARYRHVRVERETTGEAANLLWGREGLYPSIKLTDDNGRTIVKDGNALEFSFQLAQREGRDPRSWLELGIKIAAIALLVWLGASILKPIVAAIAFIAFNAMVIGIAIAGVALFIAVVRWILDVTGWTLEDVASLFRRTVEELKQLLRGVVEVLETR